MYVRVEISHDEINASNFNCALSNFAGFSGTNSQTKRPISREIFEASFAEKQLVKNGRFRESFPSKFRWKAIGFSLI